MAAPPPNKLGEQSGEGVVGDLVNEWVAASLTLRMHSTADVGAHNMSEKLSCGNVQRDYIKVIKGV